MSAQLTSESGLQAPRRVLLIQPDTHALSRDSQALQGGGYQVVPAETALDGLKRLYEDPPQLVIVAEQLGAMNGYQLSRLIKHDLAIKHIPVVMIGQSNSSLHKYWQFQAGLDGFIEADEHTNTYDPQALCEQADALLGIYESMDQRCITPQAAKVTSLKSTDNAYSLIDVHNRINQLLDQSLLEAAVMKAFHRLGDLIQDEGVLNYMFFSMLEGLLEYDVAALYFQNQNAANLNVTFHLGQSMTLPPVTLETLKEQFFRTLNDHHVLPEMISPQDSPHSKPLRFEMIGYPETEGNPDTLHLSHFQVFEVGSKLLGAFALYSRKPNIEYKAVFPLQLMMDELHHLMKLKRLSSENLYLSRSDRLTSMLQHRAFMEHLDQEFHRAQRYELDMTLAVIEIRQFKQYNNTGGYALGDAVLKHVAKLMRSCFRSTDILARLGSARLAVLMPETTLEDAKAVLCRFEAALHKMPLLWHDTSVTPMVNIGMTTCNGDITLNNPQQLVNEAIYQLPTVDLAIDPK